MRKDKYIGKEALLLTQLVGKALGSTQTIQAPEDTDWLFVVNLSYKHKVAMLAYEGYRMAGFPERQETQRWLQDSKETDEIADYYQTVLQSLCAVFRSFGLTPIPFKGLGMAENYPIPALRGAGDIDIYLIDKEGNCGAKEGDRIMSDMLNLPVAEELNVEEQHSSFLYQDVIVENHYSLVYTGFKGECFDNMRRELHRLMVERSHEDNGERAYCFPSPDFDAINLMLHIHSHFDQVNKCNTLRQVTDWMMFLKRHGNEVDWDMVESHWQACGLTKFAAGINGFIINYLGCDPSVCRNHTTNADTLAHIAERILFPIEYTLGSVTNRILFFYRNRWRFKFIRNEGWERILLRELIGYYHRHDGKILRDLLHQRFW